MYVLNHSSGSTRLYDDPFLFNRQRLEWTDPVHDMYSTRIRVNGAEARQTSGWNLSLLTQIIHVIPQNCPNPSHLFYSITWLQHRRQNKFLIIPRKTRIYGLSTFSPQGAQWYLSSILTNYSGLFWSSITSSSSWSLFLLWIPTTVLSLSWLSTRASSNSLSTFFCIRSSMTFWYSSPRLKKSDWCFSRGEGELRTPSNHHLLPLVPTPITVDKRACLRGRTPVTVRALKTKLQWAHPRNHTEFLTSFSHILVRKPLKKIWSPNSYNISSIYHVVEFEQILCGLGDDMVVDFVRILGLVQLLVSQHSLSLTLTFIKKALISLLIVRWINDSTPIALIDFSHIAIYFSKRVAGSSP